MSIEKEENINEKSEKNKKNRKRGGENTKEKRYVYINKCKKIE